MLANILAIIGILVAVLGPWLVIHFVEPRVINALRARGDID